MVPFSDHGMCSKIHIPTTLPCALYTFMLWWYYLSANFVGLFTYIIRKGDCKTNLHIGRDGCVDDVLSPTVPLTAYIDDTSIQSQYHFLSFFIRIIRSHNFYQPSKIIEISRIHQWVNIFLFTIITTIKDVTFITSVVQYILAFQKYNLCNSSIEHG
jgi:hypothetical protein